MKIEQTILKVNRIYVEGWETRQKELKANPDTARRALAEANENRRVREYLEELSTHRVGTVSVTRALVRSVDSCPHCGAFYNAGSYVVRQADLEVRFDLGLVHFAREGHPITREEVDIDTLQAIMAAV